MESINVTTEILDLNEAKRRLEVIKPDVHQLMELSDEIMELINDLEAEDLTEAGGQELSLSLDRKQEAWRGALQRINDQGGYVKNPSLGLLDFYCWHAGELVFLCWRDGEETIENWHGLADGFSGRKPVSLLSEG